MNFELRILELWTYLKDAVTHDAVVSVDELVEKLVTTVSSIPQPYLKSVVKESIKKQKSLDEGKQYQQLSQKKCISGASFSYFITEESTSHAENTTLEAQPADSIPEGVETVKLAEAVSEEAQIETTTEKPSSGSVSDENVLKEGVLPEDRVSAEQATPTEGAGAESLPNETAVEQSSSEEAAKLGKYQYF